MGAPRPSDIPVAPPAEQSASQTKATKSGEGAASLHAAAGTDGADRLDRPTTPATKPEESDAPIENKYANAKSANGFVKWLVKTILKIIWAFGGDSDKVDGIPRVKSKDIEPLIPNLKPGDIILNGNGGGLSQASMYVGDGQIVHSMATNKTMRGKAGSIWDAMKAAVGFGPKEDKTGVIREGLGEFLDRYERDTYVVVRRDDLEPEQVEKGVEHIKSLVGKSYDYDFSSGDDEYYCTELVMEYLDASLGQEHSTVFNTEHYDYGIFKADAVAPPNILEHPSLTPVAASESAKINWEDQLGEAKIV